MKQIPFKDPEPTDKQKTTELKRRDVHHSNLHKLYDDVLPPEVQAKASTH